MARVARMEWLGEVGDEEGQNAVRGPNRLALRKYQLEVQKPNTASL
jgi:hypothetical protein